MAPIAMTLKNKLLGSITFIAGIIAFLILAQALQADDAPSLCDSLPENTRITLHINKLFEAGSDLEKTSLGKLWANPEFQKFIGNTEIMSQCEKNFHEFIFYGEENSNEKAELIWRQLRLFRGEIALGLADSDPGDLSVYIAAEVDEKGYRQILSSWKELLELGESKNHLKTYELNGIEISNIVIDCGSLKETFWMLWRSGTVFFSRDREWIENKVSSLVKKVPPSNAYSPPMAALSLDNDFFKEIFEESNRKKLKDNKPSAKNVSSAKIYSILGLDDISKARFQMRSENGVLKLSAKVDGVNVKKGIWTLFNVTPISSEFRIPNLPSDICSWQYGRLNIKGMWSQIPNMLMEINPSYAMRFQGALLVAQGNIGINLHKDFFSYLATDYFVYSRIDKTGKTHKNSALKLSDPSKIEQMLAKLFKPGGLVYLATQGNLKKVKFLNRNLYLLKIPSNPKSPKQSALYGKVLGIAVIGDWLMIGEKRMVVDYIRHLNPKDKKRSEFYQSPIYQEIKTHLPTNALVLNFNNWELYVKQLFESLGKDGAWDKLVKRTIRDLKITGPDEYTFIQNILNSINTKQMPAPAQISQYFNFSIATLKFENGNLEAFWSLYPPKQVAPDEKQIE